MGGNGPGTLSEGSSQGRLILGQEFSLPPRPPTPRGFHGAETHTTAAMEHLLLV